MHYPSKLFLLLPARHRFPNCWKEQFSFDRSSVTCDSLNMAKLHLISLKHGRSPYDASINSTAQFLCCPSSCHLYMQQQQQNIGNRDERKQRILQVVISVIMDSDVESSDYEFQRCRMLSNQPKILEMVELDVVVDSLWFYPYTLIRLRFRCFPQFRAQTFFDIFCFIFIQSTGSSMKLNSLGCSLYLCP